MRRIPISIRIAAILTALIACAQAQTTWHDLSFGTSKAGVEKVLAVTLEATDKPDSWRVPTPIVVAGTKYKVSMSFVATLEFPDGKLQHISLELDPTRPGDMSQLVFWGNRLEGNDRANEG